MLCHGTDSIQTDIRGNADRLQGRVGYTAADQDRLTSRAGNASHLPSDWFTSTTSGGNDRHKGMEGRRNHTYITLHHERTTGSSGKKKYAYYNFPLLLPRPRRAYYFSFVKRTNFEIDPIELENKSLYCVFPADPGEYESSQSSSIFMGEVTRTN